MQTLPTVQFSRTVPELETQIRETHKSLADFYRSVPLDLFNADGKPEGWSPKRNLKHVTKTNNLILIWAKLPRWFIGLWPKPKNTDSVEKLRPTNRPGLTEYGSYTKSDPFTEEERERMIEEMLLSSENVAKSVSKWSEEDLDRLPGLFGGVSLRMFYLFLLKHNLHHTNVVRIRLKGSLQ